MKKLIFVLLIFTFFLFSCDGSIDNKDNEDNKNPDKEIIDPDKDKEKDKDNQEIEYVTISFELNGGEPNYQSISQEKGKKLSLDLTKVIPYKEDYRFLGWSSDDNNLFDTETIIEDDLTLYAMWESMYKDHSDLIDLYIPDVIDSNIPMPEMHEKMHLIWSTSNQETLDNYGNLNKPRKDLKLTVYLEVYENGYSTFYDKEVLIKGVVLKPLIKSHTVFGYYSTWNYFGYNEKMMETLDVINLSFAYVTADGRLDYSSVQNLLPQVMTAHNYGVRVVLSVQGYGSEGQFFSDAASTIEGRTKLANSMLAFLEKYHLDGIDIDWEYPGFGTSRSTSVDRTNYTLLVKEIRRVLKEKDEDYLITAAIPGGPYLPVRFDLKNLNNYLDYFHLMTYDSQAGGRCTHHCALYSGPGTANNCHVDYTVNYFHNQGVDLDKLVPGIAFYGKKASGSSLGGSCGSYSSINYHDIYDKYLTKLDDNIKYYYDEAAQAPYIIDKANNLFITFDDERSIEAKCNYNLNNKLGGVMIWEVGEDKTMNLLNQIYNSLKKIES